MIGNIGGKTLDVAFRRVRDLDVSMHEQLRTFAETTRRERPEFAAAVDRLVERLRRYGAGESAPQIGEPMRLRVTVTKGTDPAEELRYVARVRRDLWAHSATISRSRPPWGKSPS